MRTTPLEETLDSLRGAGQGRQGAHASAPPTIRRARLTEALTISEKKALPRYEVLQPLYNLYEREAFEGELEAVCRDSTRSASCPISRSPRAF